MIKTENFSKSKAARKFFFKVFGLLALAFAANSAQAATITVSNLNDSGAGSLRDAITQANATVGVPDTINFTTGAGTINLLTPLPAITDTVTLNGGTTPTIELNGAATQGAGSASIGLYLRAGLSTIQGFIINRFGEAGIRMDTDGVGNDNNNQIFANRIGTDTTGNSATCGTVLCGNINRGILIVGTIAHQIGGSSPATNRNIISGNQGNGIEISAGGNSIIVNNYIGTNTAGTADLGNLQHGILIANSSNNSIGGATSSRNVISGNNANGIAILTDFGFTASNNFVTGNYIGVDAGGNTALRNNGSGVLIQAGSNFVGGTFAGERNVISGNGANGVSLGTTLATANFVRANYIGVGADGLTVLGNRENGVQISNTAFGNTIGGTGGTAGQCNNACNIIANNGDTNSFSAKAGIYIDPTAGAGNAIRGNSIFNNAGIGIDLGTPGVNANDPGDPDAGPNNLQNTPVLSSANNANRVAGTLNSTPNTSFDIDFYLNTIADGMNSEGRTYVGTMNVTTLANGNADFTFTSNVVFPLGQFVTATATVRNLSESPEVAVIGDSSEFSNPAQVVGPTAAAAEIRGQITNSSGISLKAASVRIVNVATGETFTTKTNARGIYSFSNLAVGGSYIITPKLRGYAFDPESKFVSLTGNLSDADFMATKTRER